MIAHGSNGRRGVWLALLCAVTALFLLARAAPAWSLERDDRIRALLATVQVVVPDNAGSPVSSGSGTVLDAERGYILTNFHVVGDADSGKYFNDDGMAVIGLNPANLRGTPVFRYVARVVKADASIDLAVLQIVAPFGDPGARLPSNLGLTSVARGASDDLLIGDPIYVLGFPGLGGDTVTYTEGTVSGYLDENRDGVEEWIKTDAEINHGNSGGLAVNDSGEFIGVPSAGYTDAEAAGKISLIRPGDMALGYYDRWTLASEPQTAASSAQVDAVAFGERLDAGGRVASSMATLPSGVAQLFASFDYRNIPRGQDLTWRWLQDGVAIAEGVISRGKAESGSDWVNLSDGAGLADGYYELEIRLGEKVLYRGGVRVGDAPATTVTLGPLTFARGVSREGFAVEPGSSFAAVDEVYALFPAEGLDDGVLIRSVWKLDGSPVLETETVWDQGPVSAAWLSIRHPDGLPVGRYTLDVYVEGQLAQSGSFAVEARADAATTVNLTGRVYDANNARRGVSGALVIVLAPGVTLDQWMKAQFDESQILARGVSTANGAYQLSQRLQTGQSYALAVVHEDFRPLRQDAFLIPAGASDPYTLDIPLERN